MSGKIFLGVDPGKTGAIATLTVGVPGIGQDIAICQIPTIRGKKGTRAEYDLVEIKSFMQVALFSAPHLRTAPLFVTVEKSQPMPTEVKGKPMGGSIANFARGCATGWAWMLTGMGIPYQLVHPRTWQKVMLAGTNGTDTKQRSIIAAQRLFPGVSLLRTPRCRKLDSNFSDALLLAAYGMRTQGS